MLHETAGIIPTHPTRLAKIYQSSKMLPVQNLCGGQIVLPPSPQAPPGTSLFLGLPRCPWHLIFALPRPIYTPITLFASAPPFFITHNIPLNPGLPRGDGCRTIWPAHKCNMELTVCEDLKDVLCYLVIVAPADHGGVVKAPGRCKCYRNDSDNVYIKESNNLLVLFWRGLLKTYSWNPAWSHHSTEVVKHRAIWDWYLQLVKALHGNICNSVSYD